MSQILQYLRENEGEILQSLELLVKAESPSDKKALVDECGNILKKLFREHLEINAEAIKQEKVGNHLKFTYGNGNEQILITSHFDTVWDANRLSYKKTNDKIYGPGVLDMKGGIIQSLWAVKALKDLGISLDKKVVFLCTTDEETGSYASRQIIEDEAKKSCAVLVPEPPAAINGALKTSRKGVGIYNVKVKGTSSHAGNHHELGASAIKELARQITKLEELTDYKKGTTVNVGVVKGGTRRNVVPDSAEALVDFRVETQSEADRLENILNNLTPYYQGTSVNVSGELNRPPMQKSKTNDLFSVAQNIAGTLGFDLKETSVGGGSDGNFTAALGIPTLDGLGCVGDGPHAVYEHVLIDPIPQRSALLAHLLTEI
jgi:glutamate carboxypeptidase